MLINTEVFLIKAKELVFAQSGDDAVKTGVGITDDNKWVMVQQYNECEQKQSAVLGVTILDVKNIQAQTAIKPAAKLKDVVALCVLLLNDE